MNRTVLTRATVKKVYETITLIQQSRAVWEYSIARMCYGKWFDLIWNRHNYDKELSHPIVWILRKNQSTPKNMPTVRTVFLCGLTPVNLIFIILKSFITTGAMVRSTRCGKIKTDKYGKYISYNSTTTKWYTHTRIVHNKTKCAQIAKLWGQHGAHLGSVGPRWAPCWPHEPC